MKAFLGGYSDDCNNVWIEGETLFCGEYTEKRLVITMPDGRQITATLEYGHPSWDVNFVIPDGVVVRAEHRERGWDWVAIVTAP